MASVFSARTGLDLDAGTFTPVGLQPVRLGDDGLPDYGAWARQLVFKLDVGRSLLEDPIAWRAYHFPVSERAAPLADFQAWLWRWLVSGCRKLAIALPADHAKTTETTRYLLWRTLRCPDLRVGNFQKSDDQVKNVLLNVQATLASPEFIRLYGVKRPPKNREGYPWSTHAMRYVDNQSGEKDHNWNGYTVGAIAGALGARLDITVEDDINTEKNTATPAMRMGTRRWQGMVVDKTMAGSRKIRCDCGGHGQQIRVGTPFWPDDSLMYTEEIAATVLGPNDWDEPDSLSAAEKEHWVFIRKDCEQGMKAGRTLWQFRYSLEELHAIRDEDPSQLLTYERRMRCNTRRLEDMVFHEAWFKGGLNPIDGKEYPGCLNHERGLRELPPRFDEMTRVSANDPQSGRQGDYTVEYANVVLAMLPRGRKRYLIDGYHGVLKQVLGHDFEGRWRDPSDKFDPQRPATQVGCMIARHRKYRCHETWVENNGQQGAWLEALGDCYPFTQSELREINTGSNKYSLDVGIPSLVPVCQLGMLDLPYKDEEAKRFTDRFIEQFVKWEGKNSSMDDILMAFWIGDKALRGAGGMIDYSGVKSLAEIRRRPPIAGSRHLRAVERG